eukprot:5611277-Pyramimonas_sp.AAC.1
MNKAVQCKSGLRAISCPIFHQRSASAPYGDRRRDSCQPEHAVQLPVVSIMCPSLSRIHTHRQYSSPRTTVCRAPGRADQMPSEMCMSSPSERKRATPRPTRRRRGWCVCLRWRRRT